MPDAEMERYPLSKSIESLAVLCNDGGPIQLGDKVKLGFILRHVLPIRAPQSSRRIYVGEPHSLVAQFGSYLPLVLVLRAKIK